MLSLVNEFYQNIMTIDNVLLSNTFMYRKKFVFLTNFVIYNLTFNGIPQLSNGVRLISVESDDYLSAKSLYEHNIRNSIWTAKIVYSKVGIDRQLSAINRPNFNIVADFNTYCQTQENS